jgi:hypothetical protein
VHLARPHGVNVTSIVSRRAVLAGRVEDLFKSAIAVLKKSPNRSASLTRRLIVEATFAF